MLRFILSLQFSNLLFYYPKLILNLSLLLLQPRSLLLQVLYCRVPFLVFVAAHNQPACSRIDSIILGQRSTPLHTLWGVFPLVEAEPAKISIEQDHTTRDLARIGRSGSNAGSFSEMIAPLTASASFPSKITRFSLAAKLRPKSNIHSWLFDETIEVEGP